MDLKAKREALLQIYRLHEEFLAEQPPAACRLQCSHCCTANVTLTTLEGDLIADYLTANDQADLLATLARNPKANRFRPRVTTNRLAQLCRQGQDIPEEPIDAAWGACPLLAEAQCPIYPARPFGCRAMVSQKVCSSLGSAVMDPLVLTANLVLLQTIEHIDRPGCTGNLADVLLLFATPNNRRLYRDCSLGCEARGLIANSPLDVLGIPPEHRVPLAPLLQQLRDIEDAVAGPV